MGIVSEPPLMVKNVAPVNIGDTLTNLNPEWWLWWTTSERIIFPNNFDTDDLSNEDRVTIMNAYPRFVNILPSIISGIEFSFNKKNSPSLFCQP